MRRVARFIPGVLGAALISAGLGLVFLPAGIVAAGAFLLVMDRRIP